MKLSRRQIFGIKSFLLAALFTLSSAPVFAFDLVSAEPAINATVTVAPSAITLTFSSDLSDTGSQVSVRAQSGMAVDDGSLLIDGANALIGLKKLSESGKYTITYQLMSIDGEILNGNYSFTYDAPAAISTPSANPSNSGASASPDVTQDSPAQATGTSSRATDIFMIALLIISFLVLVVIGRSLRKSTSPKSKKRKKK